MNEPFVAIALNGPSFEHAGEYETDEEITLACTKKLVALIENEAVPWFASLSNEEQLLHAPTSPLKDRDRRALAEDLAGKRNASNYQLSRQLLGLRLPDKDRLRKN